MRDVRAGSPNGDSNISSLLCKRLTPFPRLNPSTKCLERKT